MSALLGLLMLAEASQQAQANPVMIAVCRNISGRILGTDMQGKKVDEPDGYSGSVFTYRIDGRGAEVTTQSSEGAGGGLETQPATTDFFDDMVALTVKYKGAIFVHVLYPGAGKVVLFRATNGFGTDTTHEAGYLMTGDCKFSFSK